ncbi:hypothetical protein KGM_204269 [Danaus plexippus plexippus]|uniref:Uncharacterized protein n=1 Tax=Danaus plexippus plexippus TaxID=278856 RepID=A0A212FCM0_DANPL|nr:hypothetical protein KGM_204269 [Danaus plexippus plexippus]
MADETRKVRVEERLKIKIVSCDAHGFLWYCCEYNVEQVVPKKLEISCLGS